MTSAKSSKVLPEYRLGIDLGGTKVEVVVLDSDSKVIYRRREATLAHDYDAIISQLTELIRAAESELKTKTTIGIGTPGALSPQNGLLRNSNTTCMNGRSLKQDIEASTGRSIKIQNDANCLALSEATTGAGKQGRVVFAVIVGTGTGAGIVVNGELLVGKHAIAGEWGHNPLPWHQVSDGLNECYCGKFGCVETFLSGPGLTFNHHRKYGVTLSSGQIVHAADNGDISCIESMESYFDQFARSLAHVINILDPDVIVLGGGMSNIESLYHQVPDRLSEYVFSDYISTPIVPALHGDSSGVFGAAML